jgi:hypothetical protein
MVKVAKGLKYNVRFASNSTLKFGPLKTRPGNPFQFYANISSTSYTRSKDIYFVFETGSKLFYYGHENPFGRKLEILNSYI